jgi:hypothetical protein
MIYSASFQNTVMKKLLSASLCVFAFLLLWVLDIKAQAAADSVPATVQKKNDQHNLFTSDEILELVLSGNVKEVLNDRKVTSAYHPLQLSYEKPGGTKITIPVEVKTRGHFRKMKTNCIYPPLLINFLKGEQLNNSVFEGQDKLKLVMPCVGDEYVVREWLVYKLYNLITPNSFRARLIKVKLDDTENKKNSTPFYGLLLEPEKQMAKRNGQFSLEKKMMRPEETYLESFLQMSVFEYMIGNTDWSVQYLQNVKLIASDTIGLIPSTVPYDFDHSGLVNAPYARPTEELQLSTVRDRRYRGYCIKDMKDFDECIALFNKLKENFYSTYTNCTLLDEKYIKSTLKYLDEFYSTINNKAAFKNEFSYPCDNTGTGNVIIKGLKND